MAYDFPNAPSLGQTVTFGNNTYQWNGAAWQMQSGNVGPEGPAGPPGPAGPAGPPGEPGATGGVTIEVSDTAPSTPADKSLWYESDTGALWLRYPDPTGEKHWLQVNSNLILPAADGNEYVMRNGIWRLKSQRLDFTGVAYATGVSCPVPAGAKMVKFAGQIFSASATAWNAGMRVSTDGSNFLAGASDYAVSGNYFQTAALTWSNYNTAVMSYLMLGVNSAAANLPSMFEGYFTLARPSSPATYTGSIRTGNFQSSTHYTGMFNIWASNIAGGQIKALWFGAPTYTGTFSDGYVDLEWVY